MEIDKIKEMLEYRFSLTTELPQKRHIIFWYDSKKEFKDLMDELNLTNVKIIKLYQEERRIINESNWKKNCRLIFGSKYFF